MTFISAGHDGTNGYKSIRISVPNAANDGASNYDVMHNGYTPDTPIISISATTGTVASYTVKKYGKVVSLSLSLQKSSATNAGANLFAGKIDTTALRPLGYATSVGYYGGNSFVGNITPAGNITVRHTGTSQQAAVTGSTYVILGFTYLVE
jgi:hypothetical protein